MDVDDELSDEPRTESDASTRFAGGPSTSTSPSTVASASFGASIGTAPTMLPPAAGDGGDEFMFEDMPDDLFVSLVLPPPPTGAQLRRIGRDEDKLEAASWTWRRESPQSVFEASKYISRLGALLKQAKKTKK